MKTFQDLVSDKLVQVGSDCEISPYAIFKPHDLKNNTMTIVIGNNCKILDGAIIYGGVTIGDNSLIEEQCIIGKPEYGYAVQKEYDGTGYKTEIAEGVTIRAGAIIYSGTKIADKTSIGHHTLIRSFVEIGENTQLGHFLCIERKTKVGNYVRCSPLSHITSETIIEDRVFIGAGVSTVNDKNMIWKNDDQHPTLSPPHFEFGAKIGSGSTIAAGVRVGKNATVGSGSMVTKDIPSNSVSYGNPAEVKKYKEE